MPHCFVSTCNNYYGRTRGNAKIKYHMLPTSAITEKWIELCGYEKGTQAPSYARVCSIHFSPDCYQRDLQHELLGLPLRKKLRKDALPDLHLPKGTQPLLSSKFESHEILKDSMKNNKAIKSIQENISNCEKNKIINIPSLMNIENQNELSSQTSITNNLDEAFKQFQAFLDSASVKEAKLAEKTSTPNAKKHKINDKMKKQATNQQKICSPNRRLSIKTNKPQIKIRLKNNNSEKKIKTTDKTEKNNKRGSLDENLLREILNVAKAKQNDLNAPKTRRRTSDPIQNQPSRIKSKRKLSKLFPKSKSNGDIKAKVNELEKEDITKEDEQIYERENADNNLQKNRITKLPMRSSFRIAKKKSIESLSDSFTYKINHNGDNCSKRVNFADKLKFMAKLQLKFEKSEARQTEAHFILPTYDSKFSLEEAESSSLHKMRIMEDVREGCMVQPSSPGHAELRPESECLDDSDQKLKESKEETVQNECDEVTDNFVKEEVTENFSNTSQDKTENEPNTSKRKEEDDEPPTAKKLRADIEENFRHRDKILNEFMEIIGCENASADQLQMHTEQLLSEIKTLNDLAREKEMEWNNIIHIKKIKEELLIRIERKRQISVMNGDKPESDGDFEDRSKLSGQSLLRYNLSRSPKSDRMNRNKHILPKTHHLELNGSFDPRQGIRNRPTLDVQSIIADYRQRHPEAVPRRGRRIRSTHNGTNGNSNVLNFSSMALGSGAQVKHNFQEMGNELNLLLSAMEASHGESSRLSTEASQNLQDSASFRDVLVQFAKLSQNERNELLQNVIKPPPPYPEVTVHPVTSAAPTPSSLLHGILTKSPSKVNNKTAFSPTLAKLLTAPERAGNNHLTSSPSIMNSLNHPSNMSISEILSTSKARNEITITPVESQFDPPIKAQKGIGNLEDDETEDSADRLVIDESNEDIRRGDNNSDAGDEVPQCQGCNQKTAQFVCAGCGNQWYCSRDCQVAAWDEHSEVCSG